jgi:methylated-DNA-protein-cysteine methyltransferase-like protein
MEKKPSAWERVWSLVRTIPRGKVMTYGQVAIFLEPLSARAVGWAMRNCPEDVPWHRVVNSRGGCSTDSRLDMPSGLQRALLEDEGIVFEDNDILDLKVYRYHPSSSSNENWTDSPDR